MLILQLSEQKAPENGFAFYLDLRKLFFTIPNSIQLSVPIIEYKEKVILLKYHRIKTDSLT